MIPIPVTVKEGNGQIVSCLALLCFQTRLKCGSQLGLHGGDYRGFVERVFNGNSAEFPGLHGAQVHRLVETVARTGSGYVP